MNNSWSLGFWVWSLEFEEHRLTRRLGEGETRGKVLLAASPCHRVNEPSSLDIKRKNCFLMQRKEQLTAISLKLRAVFLRSEI